MPQIIFGWVGEKDIIEVLNNLFTDEDQQKIYNLLHFAINHKFQDGTPITITLGINNATPDVYINEKKLGENNSITKLYDVKFSAYNKIYCLQKYINLINCKYGINLNINFHYYPMKYTFILYFGKHSIGDPNKSSLDFEQINENIKSWNRIKDIFKLEPKIYALK